MKYWSRKKIVGGSAPKAITRVGVDLIAAIETRGADWPKLLRIGRRDRDDDEYRYEAEVELAPGLILPMEHGLTEDMDTDWNDPSQDEEEVFACTMEGVEACLPHLEYLADRVHEARMRARTIVGAWRAQGLPARVVDVHLAPYDHWRGDREPLVRVLLETLDEHLEPFVDKLDDWVERDFEATLAAARETLAYRSKQRDALTAHGATGTINQLALNAIGCFGDVASTLRRFQNEWRFWLPDGTCILMSAGLVEAGNCGDMDLLIWHRNSVSVSTAVTLGRDSASAAGRPVTELIDHPFLSADMTVLKAEWSLDHTGERWLDVQLAMPWRHFCSTSGRVWNSDEVGVDAGAGAPAGNVVPFGRRRA